MARTRRLSVMALMMVVALPVAGQTRVINRIVAKVNDKIITQQELDEAVQAGVIEMEKTPGADLAELKKKIMQKKIEESLLIQEAVHIGLQVREKEVDEDIKTVKKQFANDEEFEAALRHNGLSVDAFRGHRRNQILVRKVLQKEIQESMDPSDEEIGKFYEAHSDNFKEPEQVHVRHLLIKFDPSLKKGSSRDRAETRAQSLIQTVQQELKKGSSLEDLASKYSEDEGTKDKGGDLGFFVRGNLKEKNFEKAVFSGKESAVVGPVQTSLGYHFIQVIEHRQNKALGLNDTIEIDGNKGLVRQYAKNLLVQQKSQEQLEEYLKRLKENAVIEIKEHADGTM